VGTVGRYNSDSNCFGRPTKRIPYLHGLAIS